MKKHFVVILLCCNLSAIAQSGKWFTIKAFLPYWNGAEVSLFRNNQLLYSGNISKDMFAFTGIIDGPVQGALKINSGKKSFYIPVFLEPGTIKIRDAGNQTLISYGTPFNDIYFQINKSYDSLIAQQKNMGFAKALDFKRELASEFIRNNPSSIVSVQLLKDYYYLVNEANDTLYYSLVHGLDTSLQQVFYVKEMMKEANTRYMTAIGKPAPSKQLVDSCGRLTSLFKTGQYTLISFWASWCVPCRKENSELLRVYKKYHGAGFTITGVSLDVNKSLWAKAIRQDKLLWQQLNDLKGWNSPATQAYGVKAIPTNYLINTEGIIIGKNLYAEQLDNLLNTLLRKPVTQTQIF